MTPEKLSEIARNIVEKHVGYRGIGKEHKHCSDSELTFGIRKALQSVADESYEEAIVNGGDILRTTSQCVLLMNNARNEALEEAVKVAESTPINTLESQSHQQLKESIVKNLKALKTQPAGENNQQEKEGWMDDCICYATDFSGRSVCGVPCPVHKPAGGELARILDLWIFLPMPLKSLHQVIILFRAVGMRAWAILKPWKSLYEKDPKRSRSWQLLLTRN